MTPSSPPSVDPASIASLAQKCVSLCEDADSLVSGLSEDRDAFLTSSLGDALQQLELILRALGEGNDKNGQREERSGLLRRLFARKENGEVNENADFSPPKFDVSQQGLQGNSWTISLSELLGFLAYGRKTGVLWVDAPDENFLIGLVEGRLMHATSDKTPEGQRLGEILVGNGFLTKRQLERFLSQQGADVVSGEALLQAGMICDDELRTALAHQAQQHFQRLVETKNAVFRFREGMQVPLAFHVSMDINTLLLDTARVRDEAATGITKWENELAAIMGEPEDASAPKTAAPKGGTTESTEKKAEEGKTGEAAKGESEADVTEEKAVAETGTTTDTDGKEAADPASQDDASSDPDSSSGKRRGKRGRRR